MAVARTRVKKTNRRRSNIYFCASSSKCACLVCGWSSTPSRGHQRARSAQTRSSSWSSATCSRRRRNCEPTARCRRRRCRRV
eukprot:3553729-Pleurochrysis_carterae.AAC.4